MKSPHVTVKTAGSHWRRRSAVLASAVMALMVSGCISLLPDAGDPIPYVPLRADSTVAEVAEPLPLTLGVGLPIMDRFIATTQIAVRMDDGSYAYLEKVRLSAPATISIQTVVLDTFDRAQATRSAVRAMTVARPEYEVHFDITAFDVTLPERRNAGVATITGTARLVETVAGRPLASKIFTATAPAPRGQPIQAALALEAATQDFSRQVLAWIMIEGRRIYDAKAASAAQ